MTRLIKRSASINLLGIKMQYRERVFWHEKKNEITAIVVLMSLSSLSESSYMNENNESLPLIDK